jgi:hypothetical protein
MRSMILGFVLAASVPSLGLAQRLDNVAVSAPSLRAGGEAPRPTPVAPSTKFTKSGMWTWTGIGCLVGAAAAATWAGVQAAHSGGDAVGISPAVGVIIIAGAGGVGGGLLGAVLYAGSHPD